MAMTETDAACQVELLVLLKLKAVCTRLATKPWINRSYCMSFSRVHCGDMCWWPVLERRLSQWYLFAPAFCRPAGDLACMTF